MQILSISLEALEKERIEIKLKEKTKKKKVKPSKEETDKTIFFKRGRPAESPKRLSLIRGQLTADFSCQFVAVSRTGTNERLGRRKSAVFWKSDGFFLVIIHLALHGKTS